MAGPRDRWPRSVQDLVLDAKRGDREAAAHLYRRYAGGITAYVRSQGVEDVDGVTNDVFAKAFAGLAAFAGDGRGFRSWLFTLAHSRVVDERRRLARDPVLVLRSAEEEENVLNLPARIGDTEEDALEVLADAEVARLLAGLTRDQRDVLLLRIVADLSIEQTASALGKEPGAVRVLQHRALASLRRRLAASGDG